MKKRIALILLLVVLLIPAGLFTMLYSESGSRWLIRQILSALPAQASVQQIDGSLLKDISLNQFHYQTQTETIDIANLRLAWHPGQLLSGRLKIAELSADGIDLDIKPSETAEEESAPFDWNADLPLPLQAEVDNLAIIRLHYQSGDSRFDLQQAKLSASTEQNRLHLTSLSVATEPFTIQAHGAVTLGKQFPFTLQSHWQFNHAEYGQWQADTIVKGDIKQININNRQTSPFKLELQGDVAQLLDNPRFNIKADWQELAWPLIGKAQFVSEQGYVEIQGSADDYHIVLSSPLTQDYLPGAELLFTGHGSTKDINIEELQIASKAGSFQLKGQAAWGETTAFDINAQGQDFNPAIFVADLPGTLTFDTRVNGELKDSSRKIQANIKKLSGQLRGQAVLIQGQVAMLNDQFDIDNLMLKSGRNRIDADGKLGPQNSDLSFKIDTPTLASLWPGLAGTLKGNGRIQGNWQNPQARLKLDGNGLRLQEHSIAKLAADIAYQTNAVKASKISLRANQIQTAGQTINAVIVDASGTPEQHKLKLDIQSPMLTLATALSGGLKGKHWQGSLSKLSIDNPDAGRWQLRSPSPIEVAMKDSGVDAKFGQSCLTQKPASLCLKGEYSANGDFSGQLKLASLSTAMAQPYLPDQLGVKGVLNAYAEIKQHKGMLVGQYQIAMPAPTNIAYKDAGTTHKLALGQLMVQGRLQDKLITTDVDMALTADDYLRGQAQIDTGPSQALSGQIKASIQDFALVDALVPQITDLKGSIAADLTVGGTISAPFANGVVRLNHASVNVVNLGISVNDTSLEISTLNRTGDKLKLIGSAKSGDGLLSITGITDLKGQGNINIVGNDFQVAKLPEAEVDISPNLHIERSTSGGKVTGKLDIPKAVIELAELPENAVTVSEDEVVVGEEQPAKKPLAEPGMDANIDIELGKKVSFKGFGLKTNLAGRLKVVKAGEQTRLHGTVDMKKGTYKSYGQDLTLRKGRFLFNGPIAAPWLDVEASRLSKNGDVTAILSVSGPVKSPKTRIYSEPSLPESDALAYLITGSPLSQVGKSEGNMVASAALSYGIGQLSWVKEKLGVDELEVKQGKTLQDTLLSMGQYLTEDFYVGTKLGIFNKQAVLVLKHKLGKSFSVETQSGSSQRVKLNYELDTD